MSAQARTAAPAFTYASLYTFVVLGIPDGLLGVAWPEMRIAQHQAASRLSVLIVCGTVAFFASSLLSSWAASRRWPVDRLVAGAALVGVGGGLVVGTSATLTATTLGVALLSGGGGMLDPLLNGVAALGAGARLIPLMHGLYAIGAAGAPALIAAWSGETAWRAAYLGVSAAYAAALTAWLYVGRRAPRLLRPATPAAAAPAVVAPAVVAPAVVGPQDAESPVVAVARERLAGVAVTLAAFFALSGLEIATASWAAVYLTDSLGQHTSTAGIGLLGFWVALSGARITAGLTRSAHSSPSSWLGASCLAGLAGAALLWMAPSAPVALIGLALLGAGVGPLLPLLTALTPQRVGRSAAARMIGWQLAAASIGAALISGGIGLWVHHAGVRAVAPALTITAFATAVLVAALERPFRAGRARVAAA